LVDDERDIRRLNAQALIEKGYHADTASDGAAAWKILQVAKYDLLITDSNMPVLTGVDLLKKLHAAHIVLPVVMATGTSPEMDFMLNPCLRPAAVLLKPYTPDELVQTAREVLRASAAIRQPLAPAKPPACQQSDDRKAAGTPGRRPAHSVHRILVAEKDRDLRLLYTDALAGNGFQVDGTEDGIAGWEALQATQYGLLIVEHELPKLTGFGLATKLRAAHMALPIVLATGAFPARELARNPKLRFAAMLLKPFPIDHLVGTVRYLFGATDKIR
jgi:DNA-binding response OmpR family regulator